MKDLTVPKPIPLLSPEQPCAERLLAIVDDASAYPALTYIVSTADLPALRRAAEALTRSLTPASPESVESMVGRLAIAFPRQTLSDDEADTRLQQYVIGLDDIPPDVLERAYRAAIKTRTFFPTVAELRALCTGMAQRKWRLSRIQLLLRTYDRTGGEPAPLAPRHEGDEPSDRGKRRDGGTSTIGGAAHRVIEAVRGRSNTTTREEIDHG